MDELNRLKDFIRAHIPFFNREEKHTSARVYMHWEIILASFVMVNVILLAFSVYLFFGVNEGDIFLVTKQEQAGVDAIDRSHLQELLTSFEVRDALFEERRTSPPRLPDPSR